MHVRNYEDMSAIDSFCYYYSRDAFRTNDDWLLLFFFGTPSIRKLMVIIKRTSQG
jgi:ABC-type multidrug transport system permease subunit